MQLSIIIEELGDRSLGSLHLRVRIAWGIPLYHFLTDFYQKKKKDDFLGCLEQITDDDVRWRRLMEWPLFFNTTTATSTTTSLGYPDIIHAFRTRFCPTSTKNAKISVFFREIIHTKFTSKENTPDGLKIGLLNHFDFLVGKDADKIGLKEDDLRRFRYFEQKYKEPWGTLVSQKKKQLIAFEMNRLEVVIAADKKDRNVEYFIENNLNVCTWTADLVGDTLTNMFLEYYQGRESFVYFWKEKSSFMIKKLEKEEKSGEGINEKPSVVGELPKPKKQKKKKKKKKPKKSAPKKRKSSSTSKSKTKREPAAKRKKKKKKEKKKKCLKRKRKSSEAIVGMLPVYPRQTRAQKKREAELVKNVQLPVSSSRQPLENRFAGGTSGQQFEIAQMSDMTRSPNMNRPSQRTPNISQGRDLCEGESPMKRRKTGHGLGESGSESESDNTSVEQFERFCGLRDEQSQMEKMISGENFPSPLKDMVMSPARVQQQQQQSPGKEMEESPAPLPQHLYYVNVEQIERQKERKNRERKPRPKNSFQGLQIPFGVYQEQFLPAVPDTSRGPFFQEMGFQGMSQTPMQVGFDYPPYRNLNAAAAGYGSGRGGVQTPQAEDPYSQSQGQLLENVKGPMYFCQEHVDRNIG